ncbi:ecto-ADP-ribosyltransferase 5-like [Solea senegalensis]|uniref:NAD(P)(+)--arginine ADP-ribosyltransferase n=1 Tax=Solea senegalensis TaxID=28829 RepID=A0AAV6Q7N3_SOLSE|nr:GPI-linked NAD(P)(+)--arginine ADP-ribosyltransferase 1 [Solea senegalensis]KAG7485870.1 ecto-ADP-ribosyltransferase 5-like [Solea senegalensis]
MWDRGNVLFAAVVFTALYYTTAKHAEQLDPGAVDYLCYACHQKAMEIVIDSGLLREELNLNKEFQKAWNASTQCQQVISGGIKEHTTALLAYYNGDEEFLKKFNDQVETMGGNVSTYGKNFNFKSFHFLLMGYMMLHKPKNCETVYFLMEKSKAQKGSKMKLGRFTKAETNFSSLLSSEDIDGMVVLNITSCYFAKMGANICINSEYVLLSPAEVFTVESVNDRKVDDNMYTEIVLKHSDLGGSQFCNICSRSPPTVSTQWLVLVIAALSLFVFC